MGSVTIDPTVPQAGENQGGGLGASRIRNIAAWLQQMFGQAGTAPFTFTANPFNVDASGNVTVPQTLTVAGAAAMQSTVLLAADPTLALQAATKQYVDNKHAPAAVYQYTVLTSDVSVASNTQTQVLQTTVIPALATSPNGHWIVRVVARCLFQSSFAQVDNLAAFLQVNSDFISSYASSGTNGTQALISAVLDHTLLVADGQTVQATMAVKAPGEGVVSALDPIFILRPTDITVVAQPQ